jgi:hypothetical protein
MMTLSNILDMVSRRLTDAGVDCLLIGGFAVNYHGYTRNTLDVDFMIAADRLDVVKSVMTKAGFINIVVEDNVAFFNAPECPFRVDFLRVDNPTLSRLLTNAIVAKVQDCVVKVPALNDLLAMKIFALSQDIPRRLGKDLADIAFLSVLHKLDVERDIKPLCDRHGTAKAYDLIRSQVEALKNP